MDSTTLWPSIVVILRVLSSGQASNEHAMAAAEAWKKLACLADPDSSMARVTKLGQVAEITSR